MVLMYHNIASGEQHIDFAEWQPAYDVSAKSFHAQLESLHRLPRFPENLHLTFDDGYASLRSNVWPFLERDHIRCTCFVTTSAIDKRGMLRRDEIAALAKAGVQFGTHSHSHVFLTNLSREQMEREVLVPQKILAEITGKAVTALSLPGGRYDHALLEYAQALGYREIFTSIPGYQARPARNLPELRLWPRWVINKDTTLGTLENILLKKRMHLAQSLAWHRIGKLSKRLLGNHGYHFFWQKIQYCKNSLRIGRATS